MDENDIEPMDAAQLVLQTLGGIDELCDMCVSFVEPGGNVVFRVNRTRGRSRKGEGITLSNNQVVRLYKFLGLALEGEDNG